MNQSVDEGFAQGFMHRRILDPLPLPQLERDFQISDQLLIHAAEKIIDVAGPGAIRNQTVDPAFLGLGFRAFLIVHHVIGQGIANHFCPAEHEQTGYP